MSLRFEEELARHTAARRVLALSSGTAALHLALDAVGVRKGDRVVIPVMTFAATAEAALYLGADLRFTDIDPATLNMTGETVAPLMDKTVKAVVPVDVGGIPHPMAEIRDIANEYGAAVVVDAAHSLGSHRHGKPVGATEDLVALSFYATKPITTGEGGALAFNNLNLLDRATRLRLHGLSPRAADRYTPQGSWDYDVLERGYKYNMSDLNAAVGVAQLERLAQMQQQRWSIAQRYTAALMLPQIELPFEPPGTETNWHLFVIRLRLGTLSIDRGRFIHELRLRGVCSSVHFKPLHQHSYFRNSFGLVPEDFPVATNLAKRIVSLPIFPSMTEDDVARVVSSVTDVCEVFRR